MSDQMTIQVRVKRELFQFNSKQDWINHAKHLFANCGVRQGFYMSIDANGHVMHMGKCFMAAEKLNTYPVTVYELQTNWADADAVVVEGGEA